MAYQVFRKYYSTTTALSLMPHVLRQVFIHFSHSGL